VSSGVIQMVLGKDHRKTIGASPVVTIEPRRRRFHAPISLTIPLPETENVNRDKKGSNTSGLKLLYSISGKKV
jgi:ankyrin